MIEEKIKKILSAEPSQLLTKDIQKECIQILYDLDHILSDYNDIILKYTLNFKPNDDALRKHVTTMFSSFESLLTSYVPLSIWKSVSPENRASVIADCANLISKKANNYDIISLSSLAANALKVPNKKLN